MFKQFTLGWLRGSFGLLTVVALAGFAQTFTPADLTGVAALQYASTLGSGAEEALTAPSPPSAVVADGTAAATVTASPAQLAAFTTVVGTPSATQALTVGGTDLTADIVVNSSTGYEVSPRADSGYAATATLAPTDGTVASTPVYVRLKGTAVGAYAGYVSVTSTGAATVGVAATGTVTSVFTALPTITGFMPASGPPGTTVTVTGTHLTGATIVTLNSTPVVNLQAINATSVKFDVPGGASSGPVFLTTPGGTASSTGSFIVTAPGAAPLLLSLSPDAQVAGGPALMLTIAGRGFTPVATVRFNGVAYTPTSTTAASLVVSIPASALATAGSYPVTVTTAGGTSNAGTFTVSQPSTAGAYEPFEAGTKNGYAEGPVALTSGVWTFSDALIEGTASDRFNGLRSARIRAGFIAMTFDKTTGAGTVTVNAALFGTDTGASFLLEKSIDGGATYTPVPGAPAVLTTTLTPYAFVVNQAGRVRFRIRNTSTTAARISIDDISITDRTATTTRTGQAPLDLTVFPNPATDHLTVALPSAASATVALRDLTGRCVLAPVPLGADQQLRLPTSLAAGSYLLEVRQGSATAVRRVEKQ